MIHSATGEFKEHDGKKYLVLDSTEKYEEVFSGIKIDVNANDVPLFKPLKFPTLLITIRCVFETDNKSKPQVYLDEYLYEI